MIEHFLDLPSGSRGRSSSQSGPDDFDDFDLPRGVDVDYDTLDQFKSLARELQLEKQQAQRLVDFYTKQIQSLASQWDSQHEGRKSEWMKQCRGDRELAGNGNFDRNLEVAKKAVDRFGGQRLAEALGATGAGNHPEIIRCFYRIGKALSEDGFVAPIGKRQKKSYGETFYPDFNHEE